MDHVLKQRKELAQKAGKMQMFGKMAYYEDEAEHFKQLAAHAVALEMEEDAKEADKKAAECPLHELVVKDLKAELECARVKLMYHTSARELALQAEVEQLKKQVASLEARAHWETHYGWTLPGAFILASETDDGRKSCACARERQLYGSLYRAPSSAAASDGGGAAAGVDAGAVRGCGGGGAVRARTCSCGQRF